MTERHLTIPTGQVRILEAGAGRAMILLHAFPLSADLWKPQLVSVPDGWRLVAPDLRGFGDSQVSGARHVDDHASDVLDLADALGLGRFALGGLSMGGYVAMALLRRARDRVTGLLLADTRAEADGTEARAGRAKMREALALEGAAGVAAMMVPKLLGPTTLREQPSLADWVRQQIERTAPAGIDDAIEALLTRPDSSAGLAEIEVPTLVICGAEDALTPLEAHRRLHEAIRVSTLAVVGHAGHLSNVERPEAYTMALHGLLTTVPVA
jgi:pimeloyl-ACP methyl ester carboxylesterase